MRSTRRHTSSRRNSGWRRRLTLAQGFVRVTSYRALSLSTGFCALFSLACTGAPGERKSGSDSVATAQDSSAPLINRVEHFYATAPNAEALFQVFRDSLGLPEVWPFRSYGAFASGSVSLGNVAFEFVRWKPDFGSVLPTEFSGIAFEPANHTDALVAQLTQRRIEFAKPDSNVKQSANGVSTGWITIGLKDFTSGNVFFCDYLDRPLVAANRRSASDTLAARNGGPLGVRALKEIVVGVTDSAAAVQLWRELIDSPSQEKNGVFAFGDGPPIRLRQAASASILGIVLRVESLGRARSFLTTHQPLGEESRGALTIAPAAIGGLHITLIE